MSCANNGADRTERWMRPMSM